MAFLLVISCGKDDEDLIVGEWKVASLTATNCFDSEDNMALVFSNGCLKQSVEGFDFEICMKLTFTSDGRYTFETKTSFFGETETETESGTYSIDGNILRMCDGFGDCDEGEFSVTSSSLTFKSESSEDGCKTELRFVK